MEHGPQPPCPPVPLHALHQLPHVPLLQRQQQGVLRVRGFQGEGDALACLAAQLFGFLLGDPQARALPPS